MVRVRKGEADAVDGDGSTLVRVEDVLQLVLDLEPVGELYRRDDRAAVLFSQLDCVAEMVSMPVRDRDHVDALRRLLVLRALRVSSEERVYVDALAFRLEAERCVPKPCEFHGREPTEEGPSDAAVNLYACSARGSYPWCSRRLLSRPGPGDSRHLPSGSAC